MADAPNPGFQFFETLLSTGSNQNNYSVPTSTLVVSPSAEISVTGFAGGSAGRPLWVYNRGTSGYTLKLAHNSGSSSAGNRILTPTFLDYHIHQGEGVMLNYDSQSTAWRVFGPPHGVDFSGTGYGLEMSNNATDQANDIDIAAGSCPDTTYSAMLTLTSTLTKRIDAAWAVGSGNGGMDTGSVADGNWYNVWLIRRPDTGVVDALFSLSATSPTMPTNYTEKQIIGSVVRVSSLIRGFSQHGDEFLWKLPTLDVDTSTLGTTATLYTLYTPSNRKTRAILNMLIDGSSSQAVYVSSPDVNDLAPSAVASPLGTLRLVSTFANCAQPYTVRTNTSSQVRARSDAASTTLRIVTLGYVDRRWRI